jgi:DNA-binding response OmpR family regulator
MSQAAKKLLIVDDEKPLLHALELKCTHEGFDVDTAGDGEEALKLALENDYDLLLLDLIMPKKDGFAVLEGLKDKKNKPQIIVTSNLSQDEDVKRAKELGAADYLIKSNVPLADIVDRIKKLLG